MKEIEWKYVAEVVTDDLDLTRLDKFMAIRQGYIIVSRLVEWRVRCTQVQNPVSAPIWHTAVKIGNGFIRSEYEVKIPAWLGRVLSFFVPRFLEKVRLAENGWDLDLFLGHLSGLALAEAEVPSADAPKPKPPAWLRLVTDVTGNPLYANKNLSRLTDMEAWDFMAVHA